MEKWFRFLFNNHFHEKLAFSGHKVVNVGSLFPLRSDKQLWCKEKWGIYEVRSLCDQKWSHELIVDHRSLISPKHEWQMHLTLMRLNSHRQVPFLYLGSKVHCSADMWTTYFYWIFRCLLYFSLVLIVKAIIFINFYDFTIIILRAEAPHDPSLKLVVVSHANIETWKMLMVFLVLQSLCRY